MPKATSNCRCNAAINCGAEHSQRSAGRSVAERRPPHVPIPVTPSISEFARLRRGRPDTLSRSNFGHPAPLAHHLGVIIVAWNEGVFGDGPIGMIVLSSLTKPGYGNTIHYTHSSTLWSIEETFGVGPLLGEAVKATDLADLVTASP